MDLINRGSPGAMAPEEEKVGGSSGLAGSALRNDMFRRLQKERQRKATLGDEEAEGSEACEAEASSSHVEEEKDLLGRRLRKESKSSKALAWIRANKKQLILLAALVLLVVFLARNQRYLSVLE